MILLLLWIARLMMSNIWSYLTVKEAISEGLGGTLITIIGIVLLLRVLKINIPIVMIVKNLIASIIACIKVFIILLYELSKKVYSGISKLFIKAGMKPILAKALAIIIVI